MTTLRVEIARKTYTEPPTAALSALAFEASPGDFLCVVGPSGAGKTTLLNILCGLDTRFEGSVVLGARGAGGEAPALRIAYVFQTPRLMPWLSVLDNVSLVLAEGSEQLSAARELIGEMGLAGFEDAFPGQLSGGMQRRVALARAFAVRPQLLLLDEPFVSLDDPSAWRLRVKLDELWRATRPTVVYVTHDLREALTMADRVLFLSERPGRIVLEREIGVERECAPGDPTVEALYRELLQEHPDILAGLREEGAQGPGGAPRAPMRQVS